jgi:hypothetical protein
MSHVLEPNKSSARGVTQCFCASGRICRLGSDKRRFRHSNSLLRIDLGGGCCYSGCSRSPASACLGLATVILGRGFCEALAAGWDNRGGFTGGGLDDSAASEVPTSQAMCDFHAVRFRLRLSVERISAPSLIHSLCRFVWVPVQPGMV